MYIVVINDMTLNLVLVPSLCNFGQLSNILRVIFVTFKMGTMVLTS